MGTRGWTLSTFLGCCAWILHGMSYIFLLAHVLPEQVPCEMLFTPGCTGNSSYDQSLQGIAARAGKAFYRASITPRGWLQAWSRGRDESPARKPAGSCVPLQQRSQGKPAGRAGPRDAPIPPTSQERANAGAPCWGPSCTSFP